MKKTQGSKTARELYINLEINGDLKEWSCDEI